MIFSVRVSLQVSVGELIDRITILELKAHRLSGAGRAAARRELAAACEVRDDAVASSKKVRELTKRLFAVNVELWEVEEELRACESARRFGQRFVKLARTVYKANDHRAALKRQLDLLLGSETQELKSHTLPRV
jgi:hypothetical protein